ncbi:hypothetical protein GCM10023114_34070 [Mycolicibacterium sediminis]|uniref:Uncharacterized protein n=1 Tax=Mycolicibacterium sediminis TaxID=1286180 RepID=A0A7I7R0D8_9MYCO|nr:hypothetical protein MSEDJ_56360 [Mycolicibacterium sediminis]
MHVVVAVVVVERLHRGKRLVDWHWRGRLRWGARGGRRRFDRLDSRRERSQLRIMTVMVVAVINASPVITACCAPGGRRRVGFGVIVVVGLSGIVPMVISLRFRTCWRVVAMA